MLKLSSVPINDSAALEVIGRHLDADFVSGKNPDVVHPHLPRDVTQHLVSVVELHPEHCVRKRLDDGANHLNYVVFFSHKKFPARTWAGGQL